MFEDMSTSIKNKNTSNLLTLPCAITMTAFLLYNLPDFVGDRLVSKKTFFFIKINIVNYYSILNNNLFSLSFCHFSPLGTFFD